MKMPPSLLNLGPRYYALQLRNCEESSLFRFGGSPPDGIKPKAAAPFTAFLLTIPFSDDVSCSLFANLTSLDSSSPYFVFSAAGQVQREKSKLIEACWHGPRPAGKEGGAMAKFPALAMEIVKEGTDPSGSEGRAPDPEKCFDHHKLGGFPYFYQTSDEVVEESQALLAAGFRHVFQLAFPAADDADVHCDWPFGELIFHLFARLKTDDAMMWEVCSMWS